MNKIAFSIVILLSLPVYASGLLKKPNGIFGYKWGMSIKSSGATGKSFECNDDDRITSCTAKRDRSSLTLVFSSKKLVRVAICYPAYFAADIVGTLHTLYGKPTYKYSLPVPEIPGTVGFISWVLPNTIITASIKPPLFGNEFTELSIVAYKKSDYLNYNTKGFPFSI